MSEVKKLHLETYDLEYFTSRTAIIIHNTGNISSINICIFKVEIVLYVDSNHMSGSSVLVNIFNAWIDNCNFAIILQYMYEHP